MVEVRPTLSGLEAAWDALVPTSGLAAPHLRSWWLRSAERGSEACYILVFASDDALIGGLALDVDRLSAGVRLLRPLGFRLGGDHLGPVVDQRFRSDARTGIARGLAHLAPASFVLPSATCEPFLLSTLPGPSSVEVIDGLPYCSLLDGYSAWFARRSAHLRRALNRYQRSFDAASVRHERVPTDSFEAALDRFQLLHSVVHGTRSQLLPVMKQFQHALREGHRAGEAALHGLWHDDVGYIALCVVYDHAGHRSIGSAGRLVDDRWDGAGIHLVNSVIHDAGAAEFRGVDLMRGTEPYKVRLSDHVRELVLIRASSRDVRARVVSRAIEWRGQRKRAE